jgi:hypothetical protein
LFFRQPSLLVFFCGGKIVVAVVNVDFNWFQLRFFPPLVMSLWIWISLDFYAFVKIYLILSKEDNNEIWFMILIWNIFFFFRLILIRAFLMILTTLAIHFLHIFCSAPQFFRPFSRRLSSIFFSPLMRCT